MLVRCNLEKSKAVEISQMHSAENQTQALIRSTWVWRSSHLWSDDVDNVVTFRLYLTHMEINDKRRFQMKHTVFLVYINYSQVYQCFSAERNPLFLRRNLVRVKCEKSLWSSCDMWLKWISGHVNEGQSIWWCNGMWWDTALACVVLPVCHLFPLSSPRRKYNSIVIWLVCVCARSWQEWTFCRVMVLWWSSVAVILSSQEIVMTHGGKHLVVIRLSLSLTPPLTRSQWVRAL